MKTIVLTGNSLDYQELAMATEPAKKEWAERHGYAFQSTEWWNIHQAFSYWDRIEFIYKSMVGFQRAIWLDCDAVITNPLITADELCDGRTHDIVISEDWGPMPAEDAWWRVNAGNFIIHNLNFLSQWLALKGTTFSCDPDSWAVDQAALRHLIRMAECSSIVHGPRVLNAVPDGELFGFPQHAKPRDPWQPGDFLCHLSGASNEARMKLIPYLDTSRNDRIL